MFNIKNIQSQIEEIHGNDAKQLEVIFSSSNRIMVEAPAGYGKTTAVVSRIAYLIATNQIKYPKKILALTFSVNSALKMKRDISSKLPSIIGIPNNPKYVSQKALITNYHGFCKFILRKYGHLLHENLKEINNITSLSERELLEFYKSQLAEEEKLTITKLNEHIVNCVQLDFNLINAYNRILKEKIITHNNVTHNGIITLTSEILTSYPEIQRFFTNFFDLIVIDEFQDTNSLAWKLIDSLIVDRTKLLFVGDPLQKIYGFIGACPQIMRKCANRYNMDNIALERNYRFMDNQEMLLLDYNLRQNAEDINNPDISANSQLPYFFGETQEIEAEWVTAQVIDILEKNASDRIAILNRNRGRNAEIIEEKIKAKNINYFYALFTDEDNEYIEFHKICLGLFLDLFGENDPISKHLLKIFVNKVQNKFQDPKSKITNALLKLLDALIEKIYIDYKDLDINDKKNLIIDILENRQLKQAMEYVNSRVIFTTIHSAKGLEWDFVLIPDLEKFIIPFFTTCDYCQKNNFYKSDSFTCNLQKPIDNELTSRLIEELSTFYVAVTRARKQSFISSSKERFNSSGRSFNNSLLSCIVQLPGIDLINIDSSKF